MAIYGKNFVLGRDYTCHYGKNHSNETVTATFISSSLLMCASPNTSSLTTSSVRVMDNGQDLSEDSAPLNFHTPLISSLVTPNYTYVNGGDTITLVGEHFSHVGTLFCQFGASSMKIEALFVNDTVLTCVSPPSRTVGVVDLLVYGNYREVSSSPARDFEIR